MCTIELNDLGKIGLYEIKSEDYDEKFLAQTMEFMKNLDKNILQFYSKIHSMQKYCSKLILILVNNNKYL